ncbi:MAG TPA: nucleotide exchange factor GrpE [Candidatus Obscuribacter sp.]|nr:nucleotide exchange factor GrpE [Candidatus Obscuribacter sp.]MBK9278854.1 nucleotide exchange factor GrpE [Candidatus Obscuribacter sp.]MBL8082049.1 nucleotide exchange factor GrpE [Candidatus Obscuribacter sp.]HMX47396.1 nucleotide exchange factor GrpE [Candidatus Obscuribacter sp.]HNG20417.1 nucleotide exchange factor GrpE [Candidatus Obscuribacter sp.]
MEENQNNNQEEAPVDRNDRAKAFFRAMYAGGEPDPDQFGIDVGQKQAQADAVSQAAVAHLETQLKEAEQRAVEAENLYKRLAADFENYRKRIDREREEFLLNGMQKAFEAILPALDDLEMAQSKLTEKTDSKVMFDSMKMVFTRLNRCLEQVGIKQMDVIGQPFDPRFHEPVQEVPTREVPEGAVVHQLRAGWNFKEKILRPALVNVATAPGDDQEPAAEPEVTAAHAAEEKVETKEDEFVRPTAQEVVSQTGVETCDTLDVLDNPVINRSTQDLPIEEIKAAIAEAEEKDRQALEAAAAAVDAGDEEAEGKPGKVYDLTDVEE